MYDLAYRTEKYLLFLISAVFFYSITCTVIAQDKARELDMPNYKVKLALSNLPPVNWTLPQDIFNNNEQQASLKISPWKKENLLVSFFNSDKNTINNTENNTLSMLPLPTEAAIQPLAYISAPTETKLPDKKVWDAQVKAQYKNGLIRTIAPGVKHINVKRYSGSGSLNINVIEINPALNQKLSIEPALASKTLQNTRKVSTMVKNNNALAGINASFFKPSSGVPLGTTILNEEIITGPIYNRVTLGIEDNGFRMDRTSLEGKIKTSNGTEAKIDNVNQPRMLASYTIIYSDKWGKLAPITPQYGIQVAISDGTVTEISKNRLTIPASGYVIVGPAKNLQNIKVGEQVKITFTSYPDWTGVKHAISGGPYLVKEGQIYIDAKEQKFGSITGRNPRTAVGYTKDNRLIMITIDGRQRASSGVSLYELAKIMKGFGCYNAMNLDGGSSTQMFVKDRVVNYPLNKGGSYVSTGLIVKINED